MAEPIILDGGAQMVKIKLPYAFKRKAEKGGEFAVTPEPSDAPFQRIVVTDLETGIEKFNWRLDDGRQWKIEIK
jgi:hypothetical protein